MSLWGIAVWMQLKRLFYLEFNHKFLLKVNLIFKNIVQQWEQKVAVEDTH